MPGGAGKLLFRDGDNFPVPEARLAARYLTLSAMWLQMAKFTSGQKTSSRSQRKKIKKFQ